MVLNEWVYMLALAFQLSAGLLLLLGNTKTSKEQILSRYCSQHRAIAFDAKGNLMDRTELIDIAKSVWINKCAFIYLVIGYMISVFGTAPEQCKCCVFIIVALLSTVFGFLAWSFSTFVSKKYEKTPIDVEYVKKTQALWVMPEECKQNKDAK